MALIEQLDDRTLVEQHRAGDDDAFRRIVLRHHRSLYANALRRLGDPVLAEDAVQETFLRAFRNLERFHGEYHLDAWLHRIVTNACHDIGRRQGRDSRLFDRACTTVEVEAPAADHDIDLGADPDLGSALDRLPETYREVLLLRFVEELSYPDVAEKAGISEENARARVSRGRNMLKKMLSSASGLVIWAIPPLRRTQLHVQDPDAASQAAQQVHNLTGLTNVVAAAAPAAQSTSAITNLVAQAGPAMASVGPAVTSAGPGLKAAVAAGLAAAVAIPTGVAVDRAMEKPVPRTAAPLVEEQDDEPSAPVAVSAPRAATTPTSAVGGEVGALSVGGATGSIDGGITTPADPATTATTPAPGSEPPPATSTAPPAAGAPLPAEPPAAAPPAAPPATEPPPPAPAPAPGDLSAEVTVTDAGPHAVRVNGALALVVGDRAHTGTIDGKLDVGEADPKDATAPRSVSTDLRVTLADGTQLTLSLRGTAVVTEQGQHRTFDLDVRFSLAGAASYGLAEQGTLTGVLSTRDDAGTLALTIPGKSS